jgi:hypothetical protein
MPPMRKMRCTGAINRGTSDYELLRRDDRRFEPSARGLTRRSLGRVRETTLSHLGLSALAAWVAPGRAHRCTKDKALFASSGTFEIAEDGIGRRGKRRAK